MTGENELAPAEQMIETNGVELCTQAFGDPADPPVLLVMGIGASMLGWEDGFCRMLAGADLVADAAGVLDAYGIGAAHIVGVSAGGALAQLLALDHPTLVRSLVLISATPAASGDRALAPPTRVFERFVAEAEVDWSDADSVVNSLVAYSRLLAGGQRDFDEAVTRALVRRDVERARDFAAAQNHHVLPEGDHSDDPLAAITVPTLVVHGTADPMFPPDHGEALAEEIPGARLLTLDGAGHGIDRSDWRALTSAIVDHTAAAER